MMVGDNVAMRYVFFAAGAGLVGFGFGFWTDPLLLVRALVVLLNFNEQVIVMWNVLMEVVVVVMIKLLLLLLLLKGEGKEEMVDERTKHNEEDQTLYGKRQVFYS